MNSSSNKNNAPYIITPPTKVNKINTYYILLYDISYMLDTIDEIFLFIKIYFPLHIIQNYVSFDEYYILTLLTFFHN